MTTADGAASLGLADLRRCFEGAIPTAVATASADGLPNITYISIVRCVDDDHVALSNQFFSKTTRNLAENPRASVLLVDPATYEQYRLTLVYERTERRGDVFERLRDDIDVLAALQGMEDVFRLKAADVYRVLRIEPILAAVHRGGGPVAPFGARPIGEGRDTAALAELGARLGRSPDLDTLVTTAVDGLASLFGYDHCSLLLLDEDGSRLFTIASHGYDAEGVGSEVVVGEGIIGMAAARCAPIRVGNLQQMSRYSIAVRQTFEDEHGIRPGRDIAMPDLPGAQSRLAVPAMARGELVGVLTAESTRQVAFDDTDEARLGAIAPLVAQAVELARLHARLDDVDTMGRAAPIGHGDGGRVTKIRFFPVDGSTFLDGDYLIRGVAGRILWALLGHHQHDGRTDFTNKEVRLDPSLQLPEFRDNLESRLILLKRRLDERDAPIRIEKTGRGRFRLLVETAIVLESVEPTT